ncbi:MAG: hypothetical protein JSV92_02055 [archaeon]|nr:MAG: hypothetical protein JSV92_02055 [archaeon]
MRKILPVLLVALIFAGGCVGSTVKFKECRLDYDRIREDQMSKLWIEVENTGEVTRNVQVVFSYPETVTIESRDREIRSFNVTVDPEGATSGRRYFNVYGEYVEGQPSSPWDIEIKLFANNELMDERKLTLVVLPE